jgi:folate-dependent phosphoribosylglycinamide formyltransferase PurN
MTIKEIQARLEIMRQSIQDQLRAFQLDTGTKVHSVQVNHDSGKLVATVKVQIPA